MGVLRAKQGVPLIQGALRALHAGDHAAVEQALKEALTWLASGIETKYKVNSSGCWIWQGAMTKQGYGKWDRRNGETYLAHRAVYEMFHGPLPAKVHLHHTCCDTTCVNPEHLMPVKQYQHSRLR